MAGSINKVIIVGNVGNQPEIRLTQASGEELATFSVATSERWKDKSTGEQKEKTEWHRVVVFSPGLVRVVKEYVHKGSKLYIEGKLKTREYEDESGVKKYTTEIVLASYSSTLVLLDTKKDGMEFSDRSDKEGMEYAKAKGLEGDGVEETEKDGEGNENIASDEIPF
ncbi:single-stranded DNA-binding protein [Rickettsiales endosymbiont of Trichoplax sp. H2]|uniref:single-stranded DNA-binding protein n=1 Tax=Rickettsiales endosymbiont of Trichoplax sp. H2 TaxID=2021221 RepID=UPI0012B1DA58|nr:single-stranded DNA-binding protein [Rickettsiales endosymbiont of Trichoplax sp. H2]MSO14610.1 Single-stranded DNA-binding protein [Rickettsiales endosymbiont of Trichoplax sp. H2]